MDAKNKLLEWKMHKNGSKDMQEKKNKFEQQEQVQYIFFFLKDKRMNQANNKSKKDRIQPKV